MQRTHHLHHIYLTSDDTPRQLAGLRTSVTEPLLYIVTTAEAQSRTMTGKSSSHPLYQKQEMVTENINRDAPYLLPMLLQLLALRSSDLS